MKKLKLGIKIYLNKKDSFYLLKKEIENKIKDLEITLKSIALDDKGYTNLVFEGTDEIAAYNYLISIYGECKDFSDIKEGDILKGYISSSGNVGFGIFMDIGVQEPYKIEPLLPLYSLREQLAEKKKVPVRKIIEIFGLIDNLPLEVEISKISIGLKKIEVKLSKKQVELINRWIEEGLEKLFVIGAFKEEIVNTLEKTNHTKDIITIENLGWMENILTCKFNTTAKGLIPEIGKFLPYAIFEIFSPTIIKKTLKNY